MKRIISLWLPTFATDRLNQTKIKAKYKITVNEKQNKEFPLATVQKLNGVKRILAVNNAARLEGIKTGYTLADAKALFPELLIEKADYINDSKTLETLVKAFQRYSPWTAIDLNETNPLVSLIGSGSIWIDITGCAHLYDGEHPLVKDLYNYCLRIGYQARIGLADTPGAAWAVARFNNALSTIIPPKSQKEALAHYPVVALRLDPTTTEKLHNLGLNQIGDVYNVPRAPLTSRFGLGLLQRLDQILGLENEPISPYRSKPEYLVRISFPEPIGNKQDIKFALDKLLIKLCKVLEKNNLGARLLKFSIFRIDNTHMS
ncbi:MAG: DNA polymerase Y family protein, partial [Rhodospirillales bacterium]|nr:DNA polymerase Y family protein [Rhodospirillales bacterium]